MTRGYFFKSLLTIFVAPKLIQEIKMVTKPKYRLPVNEDMCVTEIEFEQRTGCNYQKFNNMPFHPYSTFTLFSGNVEVHGQ